MATAVTLFATACSGGSTNSGVKDASPKASPISRVEGALVDHTLAWTPATVDQVDVGFPFRDVSSQAQADSLVVNQAEAILTQRCMQSRGFDYSTDLGSSASDGFPYGYGLLTEEQARARGFNIWATHGDAEIPQPSTPNEKLRATLSPARQQAWDNALTGTAASTVSVPVANGGVVVFNSDGCINQARLKVEGDQSKQISTDKAILELGNEIVMAVPADPNYEAAQQRFQACMAQAGYKVQDTNSAAAELRQAPDKAIESGRRNEFAIATVQAHCEVQVGLWSIVAQLLAAGTEKARNSNEALFVAHAEAHGQAVTAAHAVLGR